MILDRIVRHKQKQLQEQKSQHHSLIERLKQPEMTLIAEIKKASPSKGVIARDFDPLNQLDAYQQGGAGSISVLTDRRFFQGGPEILTTVRGETELPLLRKDFILEPLQVYESLLLGADVILLIAAILNKNKLRRLLKLAHELGREVLVEVHNQEELAFVLDTPARIIGINNRDLRNFRVDLATTASLTESLQRQANRQDYYLIAESGIKNAADIQYLESLGVDGVLIGETLMKSPDPRQEINRLFSGVWSGVDLHA